MSDRIIPIELCLSELKRYSDVQFSTLMPSSAAAAGGHFDVEALVRLHQAKVALELADCLDQGKEDPSRISRMIEVLSSYNVDRFHLRMEENHEVDALLKRAQRALVRALEALRVCNPSRRGATPKSQ